MEVSAAPPGFSVGAAPLVPAIFVCTPTHTSHLSPEQNLHVCGPNPFYQCWSQCASDSLGQQTLFSKQSSRTGYQISVRQNKHLERKIGFAHSKTFFPATHKRPFSIKQYSWSSVYVACMLQHMPQMLHICWYLADWEQI